MKHYTWNGHKCLIVKAPVKDRCTGCLFAGDSLTDVPCPHTDAGTDIACNVDNDIIFIKDTPEDLAKYMAERLT